MAYKIETYQSILEKLNVMIKRPIVASSKIPHSPSEALEISRQIESEYNSEKFRPSSALSAGLKAAPLLPDEQQNAPSVKGP